MNRIIAVAVLMLAVGSAFAQSESHAEATREFLDVMQVESSITQTFDNLDAYMAQLAQGMGLDEEARARFDESAAEAMEVLKDEMSWDKLEPDLVELYAGVYTEDELRELTEFYRSPLGQKFIAKMPELQQATMQWSAELMQRFQRRIQQMQAELAQSSGAG
jgi:hypothetical protein